MVFPWGAIGEFMRLNFGLVFEFFHCINALCLQNCIEFAFMLSSLNLKSYFDNVPILKGLERFSNNTIFKIEGNVLRLPVIRNFNNKISADLEAFNID